jgi:NAD(P)-dependent dehydrogenase (short-subunit alcohol dehydrogenase family)
MSGRLTGKVAVVSGVGSGIGRACALSFAREGAVVLGSDINEAAAAETRALASKDGVDIEIFAPVDMFVHNTVLSFMQRAGSRSGQINILVNCAGAAEMAWIDQMTPEQFRRTIVAEVDSVFFATQAAWPYLQRGGGSIINIASVAAHLAVATLPAIAHTAGKGAVLAMTRQLAMEGAKHRIRANTVSPGLIVTPATRPALENLAGFKSEVERKIMLERLGRPEDIAAGCLYLASDEASFVTGADLVIDGGMTAW